MAEDPEGDYAAEESEYSGSWTYAYKVPTSGLAGWSMISLIDNCYATGAVSGSGYTGGLIGWAVGSNVYDSFATGNVTGSSSSRTVGALIGSIGGTCQLINNFYNEDATVVNNGSGGVNYSYATATSVESLGNVQSDVYNRTGSEWDFSGEEPVWVMDDLPELLL
jgi:hypothetical protein